MKFSDSQRHRLAASVALVVCGALVAGCTSATTSAATTTTPPAPTTLPVAASTTTSSAVPVSPLELLGIGDSYMSAHDSNGNSFLDAYATLLKADGKVLNVRQLTDNQNDTNRVLESLSQPSVGAVVGTSDIIVLSVGGNDVDPFGVFPPGTCSPAQALSECLAAYAPKFEANLDQIVTTIEQLRRGRPTAIRILGADNPFVGWSEAPKPDFGTAFFAQVATAETKAACDVAAKHHATCIDFLHVFSGPNATDDPAKYLADDHGHPGDLGIATIAQLLHSAGLAELS
jgi:lysophospholipase L1-like esterase